MIFSSVMPQKPHRINHKVLREYHNKVTMRPQPQLPASLLPIKHLISLGRMIVMCYSMPQRTHLPARLMMMMTGGILKVQMPLSKASLSNQQLHHKMCR
jgi:hypothetical protein